METKVIPNGVGLIVDKNALISCAPGKWRWRSKRLRHGTNGELFITHGPVITGGCIPVEPKRCTGVLIGSGETNQSIVTVAHANLLDFCLRESTYFITGLLKLDDEINTSQIYTLDEVRHYEHTFPDRDIAIVQVTRLDQSAAQKHHPLPPEDLAITEGQRVYIVGHPGGERLQRFDATIRGRIPKEPERRPRAIDLDLDIANAIRDGSSGSPVFDTKTNVLLGIIQSQARLFEQLVKLVLDWLHRKTRRSDVTLALFRTMVSKLHSSHPHDSNLRELTKALATSRHRSASDTIALHWLESGRTDLDTVELQSELAPADAKEFDELGRIFADAFGSDANAVFLGGAMSLHLYPSLLP